MPYPEPDRLVFVWERDTRRDPGSRLEASPGNFLDWRARTRAFEGLAAMEPFGLDWVSPKGPEYLPTWLVTERFFELLGIVPLHGRTFRPDEHHAGRGRVVILGYGIWQRRFGGDPAVLGQVLTLDREPFEVVGVMPREFELMDDAVWAPKIWEGWEAQSRNSRFYTVIGRVRNDVTLDRATDDMNRIAAQLGTEYPETNAGMAQVRNSLQVSAAGLRGG